MTRAVVLAAGMGRRLDAAGFALPKPLTPVLGRALISYTLEALQAVGVREAFVVTGYQGERVRTALAAWSPLPLSFGTNPRYWEPAGRSLWAAREFCGSDPFLLVMCDHLLSAELLERLLAAALGAADPVTVVAADFHPRPALYWEEATKIRVAPTPPGTRLLPVLAIGKGVHPADALDTGAFYCTPEVWDVAVELPEAVELSRIFGSLAQRGRLFAAGVAGAFWYDVDTADDLQVAEALLAGVEGVAPARARFHS